MRDSVIKMGNSNNTNYGKYNYSAFLSLLSAGNSSKHFTGTVINFYSSVRFVVLYFLCTDGI